MSACNAEDHTLIPGLGRSPGEGIGYPLQYSWASLVAQKVKNPPAMRETRVRSLGWEDPLEEGMAIHSSILAWRIPMDRGAWRATVHGVSKSWTRLSDSAQHSYSLEPLGKSLLTPILKNFTKNTINTPNSSTPVAFTTFIFLFILILLQAQGYAGKCLTIGLSGR